MGSRILSTKIIVHNRGQAQKSPLLAGKSRRRGLPVERLAATDSPTGEGSTIGAPGLNDSVRNGKR